MPIQQEVAQQLSGKWKQRFSLLDLTGEPYVCCAGMFPCCGLGDPQDRNCMFLEACCCTSLALAGNRFMVQTRFDKENTACDDCILWSVCLFDLVICIASCFIEIPAEIRLLSDCMNMTVTGCMHAQQHIEIGEVKKHGYMGPNPNILGLLPPHQQQMVQMGKPAGAGGMPQMYGQPQQQPPPQVGMGGGQPPVQVQCAGCHQVFGAPGHGIQVACPFCSMHNMVH